MLDFLDFAYNVLNVEILSVKLACDSPDEIFELSKHAIFQKGVTGLAMLNIDDEKMQIFKPCISKLSRLTHLHFPYISCALDAPAWHKLVPSLKESGAHSICYFESPKFDAELNVFTDYDERCV